MNTIINGIIIDSYTQIGVASLTVEAWDKDLLVNDFLGDAVTDPTGAFPISFDASKFTEFFLDAHANIFFKIYQNGVLLSSTENSVLWNNTNLDVEVKIEVQIASTHPSQVDKKTEGTNSETGATTSPEEFKIVRGQVLLESAVAKTKEEKILKGADLTADIAGYLGPVGASFSGGYTVGQVLDSGVKLVSGKSASDRIADDVFEKARILSLIASGGTNPDFITNYWSKKLGL
jgi:hypothetical protein